MSAITDIRHRGQAIAVQRVIFAVAKMLLLLALAVGTWILVAFITEQAVLAASAREASASPVIQSVPSLAHGPHGEGVLFKAPS